jgi:hypothetical protein
MVICGGVMAALIVIFLATMIGLDRTSPSMPQLVADSRGMLVLFQQIAREEGVEYLADGGTLLGAVRQQDHIPYDDDVDVTITHGAMLRLRAASKRVRAKYGVYFKWWFRGSLLKMCRVGQPVPWLDLFVRRRDVMPDGEVRYSLTGVSNLMWPNMWITEREIGRGRMYRFGSHEGKEVWVHGPADPVPFLERMYGADWRIPRWTHCHTFTAFRDTSDLLVPTVVAVPVVLGLAGVLGAVGIYVRDIKWRATRTLRRAEAARSFRPARSTA